MIHIHKGFFCCLLILERENKRDTDLLFHSFIHSLVDSYMYPDPVLNSQCWHIGTTL